MLPEFAGFDTIFEAVIKQVLDAVEPQIPEHVANLLKGLGALAGGDPSNGQELARSLTAILFGFDLDALRAPAEHLNDLIGGIRTAGGDLQVIEGEIVRLTAECGVVSDGLRQSPIDVPLVQARLARVTR